MGYRTVGGMAALLLLGAGLGTAAPNRPAPAPTPPAGDILLAYKYRAGAVYRYRLSTTGTVNLDFTQLEPARGLTRLDLSLQFDLVQKVSSVMPDGTATVTQSVEGVTVTYRTPRAEGVARLQDGEWDVKQQQGSAAPIYLPDKDLIRRPDPGIRLAPSGHALPQPSPPPAAPSPPLPSGADFVRVFGIGKPGLGMLALPAEPLGVGHSWEEQQTALTPIPVIAGLPIPLVLSLDYKKQHTLREWRSEGGHRIAVIESKSEATLSPDAPPALPGFVSVHQFTQSATGTTRLRSADGEVLGGDYDVSIRSEADVTLPGSATGRISLTSTFHTVFALRPNTPAKTAPPRPRPTPKSRSTRPADRRGAR